tara:strand:+ start:6108 stop:6581 length:474 start_codon:yes stop_codon:yes gene_type:complete
MKISYEKNYRKSINGVDWVLFSATGLKESLVVQELEYFVQTHPKIPFSELGERIKEVYRNTEHKSRCSIYVDDNQIDITVKGVFPRFYVLKNQEKRLDEHEELLKLLKENHDGVFEKIQEDLLEHGISITRHREGKIEYVDPFDLPEDLRKKLYDNG